MLLISLFQGCSADRSKIRALKWYFTLLKNSLRKRFLALCAKKWELLRDILNTNYSKTKISFREE